MGYPAESVSGVLILTGEGQTLRIFDTNAVACELGASTVVFDSFTSRWIPPVQYWCSIFQEYTEQEAKTISLYNTGTCGILWSDDKH